MQLLRGITALIGQVWGKGCLGKGIIVFAALVVLGMCSSALGLNRPAPASAPAADTASSPEPSPEVAIAPTDTPTPTEAPVPTKTPVPTRTPRPTPRPLPTLAGVSSANGTDCPADHPVKGNIRDRDPDKGAKIYHVPGSGSYRATKPERCFVNAAEAELAGYRAPR